MVTSGIWLLRSLPICSWFLVKSFFEDFKGFVLPKTSDFSNVWKYYMIHTVLKKYILILIVCPQYVNCTSVHVITVSDSIRPYVYALLSQWFIPDTRKNF